MTSHISPYHAPGFYADALAKGQHRDIVGGRWDETGRLQFQLLLDAGLTPQHHILDLGAGSLRLGCKLVPWMEPGHYWGTDMSGSLMRAGRENELTDPDRLAEDHLVEDASFEFPGVPERITHIMAFAVFTHLPVNHFRRALLQVHRKFPHLELMLFTVFLAPDPISSLSQFRQRDGVVTHDTRAPFHMLAEDVMHLARASGFDVEQSDTMLPRGQVLFRLKRG